MSRKVSGYFIASGVADNIECGFIPDEIHLIAALGATELEYMFLKILADLKVAGRYGFTYSTSGVPEPATSGSGFTTYDAAAPKQMIPAPDGDGYTAAAMPAAWTQSLSSGATARSTTALGTLIKPTKGNETGLVYECTNDATGGSTEPTWPTRAGESVTDGSVIWIARASIIKVVGVKGFTVQATISTDGQLWAFTAEKHDRYENMGDLTVENPATFSHRSG